jgi:uncharacterized protein (TIGR02246 family)
MMLAMSGSNAEPRAVVEGINAAWRAGRANDSAAMFHEQVVMLTPTGERIVGREAMVRSYAEFAAAAVVDEYTTSEHTVDAFGTTTVVAYRWQMAWRADGESYRERGRDIFVLTHSPVGWQVVWRTLLSDGENADSAPATVHR